MRLPSLGNLGPRLVLAGVLGVSFATVGTVLWLHYSGLVDAKADLTAKAARLEEKLTAQTAVTSAREREADAWRQASQVQSRALELQATSQARAGEYLQEIRRVQSKHDLTALAKAKPALVEAHINAGTDRAFRLLERASRPDLSRPDADAPTAGTDPAGPQASKP
jgi:hypothetical protein